jgi:signal transduction histidine kinase
MKTEFVSTMSHELRTPLNVILGFCEMLRDPATTRMEREVCHQRIELAARILLELVESTLEVGRLETGRDEPALEPVELAPMWEKLGREYAVLPRRGAVGLEWSTCPAGVVVEADPRRLAMVVRNLVSNALKFTDEGFVRAEAFLDGLDIVLRVSDSGIGIAPADQEKVFEIFCQADGSDSRRHGGTGLGLYIVRRFSAQFGGTVELESAPGRGSVFTVRLPVARIVRQTPLPEPRPGRVGRAPSDHDERV